jgi:uncharacterized surface protein with fasciclin (FAS1) repeats
VDNLLKPENKATLTKLLTCHVVAGKLSAADIEKQIKMGHGKAELKTFSGGSLWATMDGSRSFSRRKGRCFEDHPGQRVSVERSDPCG